MIYTEHFEGIKLDIQAVDLTINDKVQQGVRDMIKRLRRFISEINWVDIYFKNENNHPTGYRTISIRLGIPGNDVFASESGDRWTPLLKKVEGKLRRQLTKRKREGHSR
jgi:putative sigma-54 modulation protein